MLIELSSKTRLALLFYSRSSRDSVRLLRPFFFPFVAQTECVSLVHLPPSVFKLAFGYFHHFCFFVEVFLFFHQAQGSLQLTTESFGTGLLKTFLLNNSKIEFFSMLASITLFQISVFLVLGMTGVFLLYCEMLLWGEPKLFFPTCSQSLCLGSAEQVWPTLWAVVAWHLIFRAFAALPQLACVFLVWPQSPVGPSRCCLTKEKCLPGLRICAGNEHSLCDYTGLWSCCPLAAVTVLEGQSSLD